MSAALKFGTLRPLTNFEVFNGTRPSIPLASDFFIADLDGDGGDEIIYVAVDHSYSGNFDSHSALENSYLHIFSSKNGIWSDVTSQYLSVNEISGSANLALGDFNGDKKLDFFVPSGTDTNYFKASDLYLSNINGGYQKSTIELNSWNHGNFSIDINGDGYSDVLITDYGQNQGILFGGNDGLTFKKFKGVSGPNYGPWSSSGIAAADFLGNGTNTIIFADDYSVNHGGTSLYSWSIGGDQTVELKFISSLPEPIFKSSDWSQYGFGSSQPNADPSHDIRVIPFKFIGDDLVDAIVISRPTITNGVWPVFTGIQFLKNQGNGNFEDVTNFMLPEWDYKLGASPYNPLIRDFNNDGRLDIFLSSEFYNSTQAATCLLMQQSDGTFSSIGKTEFSNLWNQAINLTKQLQTVGYVFTDWGRTMSVAKDSSGNLFAMVHVVYQDSAQQIHEQILSAPLTMENNRPPVAYLNPDQLVITEGKKFTFALPKGSFIDPDAKDKLSYSSEDLPSWLSIDPKTGKIFGKADYSSADGNPFIFHLKATDTAGNFAINELSFFINNSPIIKGSAKSDNLVAGAGDDTIYGGLGNDTLIGWDGADRFAFSTKPSATNIDTVVDFVVGQDQIQLSSKIFSKLKGAADFFSVGTEANSPINFLVYNSDSGALSYDADGNGVKPAVQIAFIGQGLALTEADFVIV